MKQNYKIAGFILLISAFVSAAKCTEHPGFTFDSGRYLAQTAIELVLNELPQYDIPQVNILSKNGSTAQFANVSINQQAFHADPDFLSQIEPVKVSLFNKKPLINHLLSRITKTIHCNSAYL